MSAPTIDDALVAALARPAVAEAAGHAGIAYGLAGRLATLARARLRGRAVLSSDMLAAHGLNRHSMFVGERLHELVRAVSDACDFTIDHLDRAEASLTAASVAVRPVFLPLVAVRPLVRRIRAAGERLAREPVLLPHLDLLVRITWRAIRSPGAV